MKPFTLVLLSLLITLGVFADIHGLTGGLVVQLGGETAELSQQWKTEGYLFHHLETDPAKVARIRREIQAAGAYGKATARAFDGTNLPSTDTSVNLLLLPDGPQGVAEAEIRRVLAPNGVALASERKYVKPVPDQLDEWTHYHHDPQGTMVGGDTLVGPPRRLQWVGAPKWLRNHDFMSSMHAMVTSGGRVFYIIDEGLRNHIFLPSDWKLVARDAFNGTILWKQPLQDWHPQNWPLKSGPGDLPRRLVATPETVFATAGLIQPLTAFDARTGRKIRSYAGTDGTVEIIYSDGTLYLLTDPKKEPVGYRAATATYKEIGRAETGWAWARTSPERGIVALEAVSGRILWQHHAKAAPLTLTVADGQVFFHDGESLVALDRKTGSEQWRSEAAPIKLVRTGGSLRVAYSDGVVAFAEGIALTAFEAKTGRTLWKEKLQKTSHHCPEDLFIINGQIWSPRTGRAQQNGTHFKVINLRTGEVDKDFVAENLPGFPMHPRCYPSRATQRYIISNGMGAEFYELGGTSLDINNYIRGSCIYGVMPANGLLYKPPDSCACYYQSKLEYFCALAPAPQEPTRGIPVTTRLEKGPAYGKPSPAALPVTAASWPIYRGDVARSGSSASPVSPKLEPAWTTKLGGRLTQPVVAGDRAFVAAKDGQTVFALDAKKGSIRWSFTADGRIDSPPTLHRGSVLFGSADGHAYCLRAEDGALAWRYLVAPEDRQLVCQQQPESVWPVSGSLLVYNDIVYCLAGRNMFLDGGLRLALLDAGTGRELSVQILDEKDPATGLNLQTLMQAKYMPVANPDLFSCNGTNIFMQTQKFDLEGNRIHIAPVLPGNETPDMAADNHLFCQTGFLDNIWFHRSFWIYGNNCGEGWAAYPNPRKSNPTGRLMAFDNSTVYGFRSDPLGNMLQPRQTYVLYAADKQPTPDGPAAEPSGATGPDQKRRRAARNTATGVQARWQIESPPLLVNAMALGGKTLFVAGPPDLADETKMLGYLPGADDDINRQLRRQEEAWHGRHGGILWALAAENGQKLAEYKLESYPVFDGLIAAEGRLFMAMLDGTVRSFK